MLCALTIAAVLTLSDRGEARRSGGDNQQDNQGPQLVRLQASDGGLVHAHLYGTGARSLVLAHGGQFNKESWQDQAREFVRAGFRVLAIDFRGYGESRGPGQNDIYTAPLHLDVLAAVHHLRHTGAESVFAVGASLGGWAVATAAIAEPHNLPRIVLLSAVPRNPAAQLTVRKLYIMARDDANAAGPRLPALQKHYAQAPAPKELILLEGPAHAQFLFKTGHARTVMNEIRRFLTTP
jgi:pimeloyl-ACP methyl ester carboxylesterase